MSRLPDNEFQLNDPYVSRRRCTIYTDGACFSVSDLNSTNNTYLNENILSSPKVFMDRDRLMISRNIMILTIDT